MQPSISPEIGILAFSTSEVMAIEKKTLTEEWTWMEKIAHGLSGSVFLQQEPSHSDGPFQLLQARNA